MAFRRRRSFPALGSGAVTPARLAAALLCAASLFGTTPAHAQGFKQLPEARSAIQGTAPSFDQLFRVESEAALRQRMVEAAHRENLPPPLFPPAPTPAPYFGGRAWPHTVACAEASYVCYGRLLFEQINAERYGWDLGLLHPFVATGIFYWDVATLPYHLATDPCRCYECDAGYCLPGSPVPLLLYRPELSASGALAQAAVIGAVLVAFP